jgi:hypothetical protein
MLLLLDACVLTDRSSAETEAGPSHLETTGAATADVAGGTVGATIRLGGDDAFLITFVEREGDETTLFFGGRLLLLIGAVKERF